MPKVSGWERTGQGQAPGGQPTPRACPAPAWPHPPDLPTEPELRVPHQTCSVGSLRLGAPTKKPILGVPVTYGCTLTWNTVTMAHSRESKFFLSGIVSPVSVRRLNLQPKMCIPRILGRDKGDSRDSQTPTTCPLILCPSRNNPVRPEDAVSAPFYRSEPCRSKGKRLPRATGE